MIIDTLISIGIGAVSVVGGISATALAVNWYKYAKSEWASVTGNSFWKHCRKKYFQRDLNSRKGYAGEHELSVQLEKVSGQKKVLYNVLIPAGKDETTEIDAVMIHETGIYVFENKNYSGTVGCFYKNQHGKVVLGNVNPALPKWNVVYSSNKKTQMNSPVLQNEKHLYFIKRFLGGFNVGSQRLFSYITFNNDAKVKGAPLEFHFSHEGCMLMANNLADNLSAKIGQRSRILTPRKIEAIASKLEPYARVSDQARAEHVERIKANTEQSQEDLMPDKSERKACISLHDAIKSASEQEKQPGKTVENKIMRDYMNMFRG